MTTHALPPNVAAALWDLNHCQASLLKAEITLEYMKLYPGADPLGEKGYADAAEELRSSIAYMIHALQTQGYTVYQLEGSQFWGLIAPKEA